MSGFSIKHLSRFLWPYLSTHRADYMIALASGFTWDHQATLALVEELHPIDLKFSIFYNSTGVEAFVLKLWSSVLCQGLMPILIKGSIDFCIVDVDPKHICDRPLCPFSWLSLEVSCNTQKVGVTFLDKCCMNMGLYKRSVCCEMVVADQIRLNGAFWIDADEDGGQQDCRANCSGCLYIVRAVGWVLEFNRL